MELRSHDPGSRRRCRPGWEGQSGVRITLNLRRQRRAGTRIADRSDAVHDEIWREAAMHFDEQGLAMLTLHIAVINLWNRLNIITRQVAGDWAKSAASTTWQKEDAVAS